MSFNFCIKFHPNMSPTISIPSKFSCFHHYSPRRHRTRSSVPVILSVLGTFRRVTELAGDDVLEAFMQERELSGDFIAKISDKIWLKFTNDTQKTQRNAVLDGDSIKPVGLSEQELNGEAESGGFLKLKSTNEWVLGDTNSAPVNKKKTAKEIRDDSERRRKLNLLKYEALKRELLVLTLGIGTMCTGYCLTVLSVEAAVSYAIGVLFSCLYLQLLCQHADNISRENIPDIFMQKKSKKIGIRSQDLEDFFEKSIKGTGIALSSPRLVIPAAIYGVWELCQHFGHDILDFQLAPAMLGIFAYKAAALVQVYRDNEDLQFIFPDNEGKSGD
ncbi:OLC1v1004672C1 [Oldenlandia corymbosa var. corymbosa]|uniref:OLC1v1004672C1 n=1 Tax=Oldenlandia corymbosa var. corymbosa TaxID=529605 RepID=A0AAV1DCU3_OLDCO|nr:OLC1v1004672C1 [Oldenlandia corymbosa var. corymbosa]